MGDGQGGEPGKGVFQTLLCLAGDGQHHIGAEVGKSRLGRDLGNAGVGIEQQELGVLDAGELDVLHHRIAGDLLEQVGQVIGADIEDVGQLFQGKVIAVVGLDIVGDVVDLFLDAVLHIGGVLVVAPGQIQPGEEIGELGVDHQVPHAAVPLVLAGFRQLVQRLEDQG